MLETFDVCTCDVCTYIIPSLLIMAWFLYIHSKYIMYMVVVVV